MKRWSAIFLFMVTATADAGFAQDVKINFTQVPAAGAGPDSRGNIEGTISGIDKPQSFKIVLYAHTDEWYVQPVVADPYTDIGSDGRWGNWTHLGQRYAALVVRPAYRPEAKIATLPRVGGNVVARADVAASGSK